MPKNKSKSHFSSTKELVAKPSCNKHRIRYVQLIQILKPHGFFCSFTQSCTFGLHFYSFGFFAFNLLFLEHVHMLISK
jgi:hypothetical protein